ncbi:Maintenance of telomere capping protein 6 [Ophidiomyces ophidiicola]|nr:Maintenance of telomere capping protein 6 [Ophidiomyces ophidiicola]KAI1993779.1 Maintenance of telomere capping protein 6 [Ophidiomyces ophidiicola]KAI1997667.1 Maintenance of telomere capping protein 6 [Ophidiomyces ophidiicola]KAI1999559.1 Maintenance of telomere capping protein 6 [Ophidiomyces ophidiicola]
MGSFVPSNGSRLQPPWSTVQLSQRDVSLRVPINFVTQPAVSLSAACFGKKVYDENAATRCVSNLLSVGYRRLHVDLYWAVSRKQWSLCPVTIPIDITSSPSSILASSSTSSTSVRDRKPRATGFAADEIHHGRETSEEFLTRRAKAPITKSPLGTELYQLGPFSCSTKVDIATVTRVVSDYFDKTQDTLNAQMVHIILNAHAASSFENPEAPAPAPKADQLPTFQDSLKPTLDTILATYLYTPPELSSERGNLNRSWYTVLPSMRPLTGYFSTQGKPGSFLETQDGWPNEGFLELSKAQRLLLGWGTVDPQMKAYKFDDSNHTIFPSNSISTSLQFKANDAENSRINCLCNDNITDIATITPWGLADIPYTESLSQLSLFASKIVDCGISPLVNYTIFNVTADEDIEPYRNVSLSSTWSWTEGEPLYSMDGATVDAYRCSVMDLSLSGRWRASGCTDKLFSACRIGDSPFEWTLSKKPEPYLTAGYTCPENSSFSVPRTALENTYLYRRLVQQPKSLIDPSSEEPNKYSIWIDLNSFDVPRCWVTGGPKAQCPYEVDVNAARRRNILVPSIAAIIILIITALTLFVKCNANRSNSRRTRVIGGWEYEGVPS